MEFQPILASLDSIAAWGIPLLAATVVFIGVHARRESLRGRRSKPTSFRRERPLKKK